MDKVKELLDAYGIPAPVTEDTVGVFHDETLDALYDQLIEIGSESEQAALTVGATIEDLDIFDIRVMRTRADAAAVIGVYDKLECGSNNHMRAFTEQLAAYDLSYQSQYLESSEYDAILAGESGSCGEGGGGGGRGWGR